MLNNYWLIGLISDVQYNGIQIDDSSVSDLKKGIKFTWTEEVTVTFEIESLKTWLAPLKLLNTGMQLPGRCVN